MGMNSYNEMKVIEKKSINETIFFLIRFFNHFRLFHTIFTHVIDDLVTHSESGSFADVKYISLSTYNVIAVDSVIFIIIEPLPVPQKYYN